MPYASDRHRLDYAKDYYLAHKNDPGKWEKYRKTRTDNHALRKSALSMLKLEAGCVDCGYNTHPDALDFDHVRGEKLFAVGPNWGTAWPKLFTEIDKCEVRCANCHRIQTGERRQGV